MTMHQSNGLGTWSPTAHAGLPLLLSAGREPIIVSAVGTSQVENPKGRAVRLPFDY
jgi:hypothetical protein